MTNVIFTTRGVTALSKSTFNANSYPFTENQRILTHNTTKIELNSPDSITKTDIEVFIARSVSQIALIWEKTKVLAEN